MRTYKDKLGYSVRVSSISGCYDFEGVIEGSASGARLVRFMKAEEEMKNSGVYYWDFEAIKNDSENSNKANFKWPARERWEAKLKVKNYMGAFGDIFKTEVQHLKVVWFSEGGDPMATLENIVKHIDFQTLCHSYVEESYD